MKTVLLLLAAVSWTAAIMTSDTVKVLSPNREYRYEYESQMLTGIPTLNSQYSGLKIKARVIMHVESDKYVSVKLTSIEVHHVREETGVVPTTWVSPSLLEPVPAEHNTVLVESLVLPIKFRYEDGLVTKVYAISSDPYWSVNIKRGIISLMNLDLNVANPVPVESSVSKSFMGVINADYNTMSDKSVYKVIEPSTLGDCETIYSLVPIPSISELMVSKVIDTKRCSPKVMGEWGLFSGIMSGRNSSEMNKMIHPSVSVDYVLSGSRHEFLIKSAVLTGKYIFAPIVEAISSMDGYVIQKLTYIKDEPIDRRISFISTPVPLKKGLHAYIPLQSLVTKEVLSGMSPSEGRIEMAKIEMVDRLLESVVQKTVSKVEKEVPDMVSAIVSVLRTLSKDELMDVARKYCRNDISGTDSLIAKKKILVLDILPTLPHPEVPLILVRLVKEGHISGIYAATMINVATLLTTPSPVIINELVEMSKDADIVRQPVVHRAVILGVGVLSHKLVNMHIKMGLSPTTTSALIKNIVREIKSLLETSDVETKIAVIKCIGNSGIIEFFPDVERLVKDKTQSKVIRSQAVYALRRMTVISPKSIRSILLPVYLDPKEPQDVRVAAFLMIMETTPGFGTLQMIGKSLNAEPSIQIASFVYSYLQNVARTSIPDLKPMSYIVRTVLLAVKPIKVSPIYNSKSISIESYSRIADVAFGAEVDKIHRINRALPAAIIQRITAFVFGKSISLSEIGVELEGIDEIVRKLVGTNGILSDIITGRGDITNILDPLVKPDLGRVEREIKKLLSETDLPMPEMESLRLGAYIKVLGNELNFVSATRETIKEIITTVKSSSYSGILSELISGYNIDIVKALPFVDNSIVLPTPIGLPITLNLTAVSVIAIKGQVKVDGLTTFQALWNNPSKISLAVNIRPSTQTKIYQSLGIQHDIISIGATVQRTIEADIPMSFKVDIDRAEEKVKLRVDVPKQISPVVRVSMMPGLFKHFVPIRISSYSASMYDMYVPRMVPISCENVFTPITIRKEYVVPVLAMKAKVAGIVNYPFPSMFDPTLLSMSEQDLVITLEPAYSSPDAVIAEVYYGDREVVGMKSQDGWFGWLGGESPEVEQATATEFMPVTPNSIISEPTKKQIFVDVMTVGGYHDAKIQTKLTLIHDPSWMVHQVNLQIIGSQVITSVWKAKVESLIHVPRLIKAIITGRDLLSTDVITSTDFSFGTNSFTENTIIAKLLPAHLTSVARVDTDIGTVQNISVKLVFYYGRVASNMKENIASVAKIVKPMITPYITKEKSTSMVSVADNVELIVQIFPQIRKINAIIAAPGSTIYMYGIPVPKVWPFVQPIIPTTVSLVSQPILPEITTMAKTPMDIPSAIYSVCISTPANITTIGNNTIPIPEVAPGCEIVLAHDSSPQSLYTVFASPVTAAGTRTIKMIIPHFKVEVARNIMNGEAVLKINDALEPIPVHEPIVITGSIDGKVVPVLEVIHVVSGAIRKLIIKAPEVGIIVELVGQDVVKVKVSPILVSSASGMCAFVPDVPMMRLPASSIGVNPISLFVPPMERFVVKSEQCPANGGMRQYGSVSSCHMLDRNVKINRVSEGITQMCFSVKPIPACSGFCSPVNSFSERIGFHCMPATDFTARTLATDVTERVLTELANKVVHTYQPLMIPTECIA